MIKILLLFLASGASAVKLECTYWSTRNDPLNCEFKNATIVKGEAIEYVALDVNVKKLSFLYCNMTIIPSKLFENYSKIEKLDISNSGLLQLLPGEFQQKLLDIILT